MYLTALVVFLSVAHPPEVAEVLQRLHEGNAAAKEQFNAYTAEVRWDLQLIPIDSLLEAVPSHAATGTTLIKRKGPWLYAKRVSLTGDFEFICQAVVNDRYTAFTFGENHIRLFERASVEDLSAVEKEYLPLAYAPDPIANSYDSLSVTLEYLFSLKTAGIAWKIEQVDNLYLLNRYLDIHRGDGAKRKDAVFQVSAEHGYMLTELTLFDTQNAVRSFRKVVPMQIENGLWFPKTITRSNNVETVHMEVLAVSLETPEDRFFQFEALVPSLEGVLLTRYKNAHEAIGTFVYAEGEWKPVSSPEAEVRSESDQKNQE